jgi:hypothetical protein
MHLKHYNGRLAGFESGGKQMFMNITIYLRRLHKAGMLCRDLVNRVFIVLPANIIHISFVPLRGTDLRINIEDDIKHNLFHFRFLVGMLMNCLLKINQRYRSFVSLFIDFYLFFSRIFASLNDVQEANCFQLLHPLFYNKK